MASVFLSFFFSNNIKDNSEYNLEYNIYNNPIKNNFIEDLDLKYDYLLNCQNNSSINVCSAKSDLKKFISCAKNKDKCKDIYFSYFNMSDHLDYFKNLIQIETQNDYLLRVVDSKNTIVLVFRNTKKNESAIFDGIVENSIILFNNYLNTKFSNNFEEFLINLNVHYNEQLKKISDYNFNLTEKNKNLSDYIDTITNLNKIYLEDFNENIKNLENNFDFFKFELENKSQSIQSKNFFTQSQIFALFFLLCFWILIFFYFIKRNSLLK